MENATIIEGEAVPVTHINLATFLRIPAVRQLVLLFGVAGAVAAGFAIVLWAQTPGYSRLYSGLDSEDAAQIADTLRAGDYDFKLDLDNGTVMVETSRLQDARLELASQGLPQGVSAGMESLKEQPTFGQSQFRENVLYQHALEAELARTISHIAAVRDARVHLALPKQSAFIRDRKPASASVMLNLNRSMAMGPDQAAAIVSLIASSVPNLLSSNITIIDQQGRLLSTGDQQADDALIASQYKLAERVERTYKRRIEDLLTPLLGPGRVRAEVVADMDFTVNEETRESFDPGGSVLVSESVTNNRSAGDGLNAQGIPGALSNQPPATAGTEGSAESRTGTTETVLNSASSSTRNFEVDRTVSRKQQQSGTIRRLSIAVLVDDTPVDGVDGAAPTSLEDSEIERITALVKEAVGFSELRGDTVVVVNAAFHPVLEAAPLEEPKLWEKPIFIDSLKLILGVFLALALAFGIVRPMLRNLLVANADSTAGVSGGAATLLPGTAGQLAGGGALALPSYDEKIAAAKNLSGHDPAQVAQVVKKWVGKDAA